MENDINGSLVNWSDVFPMMQTVLLALFAEPADISDTYSRKLLHCSIVHPKLEYASELWSAYTCKDKLLLENVQCRAVKFILNYPKDMFYKQGSVDHWSIEGI